VDRLAGSGADAVTTPMGTTQDSTGAAADLDVRFRASRAASLAAVNSNTYWSIAVLLLVFVAWDAYADPANWRAAFQIRVLGAAIVIATGLFQKLPGNAHWMPLMAKSRLVVAVVTAAIAASMLDRGYGFAVAAIVAIILTGPYIALDVRDLLVMNTAAMLGLTAVMVVVSLDPFDMIGTAIFALLAVAVSMLLGRALEASNRRAFALELELHRDSRTDALTSLDNRRAMEERGIVELKRASRAAAPVSLILCDIDHFKAINDRHGHEAGDAVLRSVAKTLRAALRETDLLSRWGGEEFLAVLVDTDARHASEVAERMRAGVEATALAATQEHATISLGVATLPEVRDVAAAWEALVKQADAHLYRAKSAGRNRVVAQ
jgi:diguanylate cyclase (GGDEF)-like protein